MGDYTPSVSTDLVGTDPCFYAVCFLNSSGVVLREDLFSSPDLALASFSAAQGWSTVRARRGSHGHFFFGGRDPDAEWETFGFCDGGRYPFSNVFTSSLRMGDDYVFQMARSANG